MQPLAGSTLRQLHQRRQETCQRLAAAGGRDQRVQLVLCQQPVDAPAAGSLNELEDLGKRPTSLDLEIVSSG